MGWLFTQGASRADIIKERIAPWDNKDKHGETIAHAVRGNVLWTVNVVTDEVTAKESCYIGCDLLQKYDGDWGYKDMTESCHPYYYTCPLKFLDLAPVANQAWRDKVNEYHAKRQRKVQVGHIYKLNNCKIPEITILTISPLRGEYKGMTYRVSKNYLGEEIVLEREGTHAS